MKTKWILGSLLLLAGRTGPISAEGSQSLQPLHPRVILLDAEGQKVADTLRPISTMQSCGACHDTSYIATHSFHVGVGLDERTDVGATSDRRPWDYSPGLFGRWSPIFYRYLTPPGDSRLDLGTAEWIQTQGWRHVGGGPAVVGHGDSPLDQRDGEATPAGFVTPDMQVLYPVTRQPTSWNWAESGTAEMNCFICHLDEPDNAARIESLASGHFDWASTATLANTGLVQRQGDSWSYDTAAFDDDGSVSSESLNLGPPMTRHCGQCHGQTHNESSPLKLDLTSRAWSTATKGQVFSSQRIFESAVNLRDKQQATRPWDVHAQALLDCKDCHFSMNNPAAYEPSRSGRPRHLLYEPRRLAPAEFLRYPSHQFAKGQTAQGTVARHLDGTMRRCDECHDAEGTHDWLPYQRVHFMRLSCESCHVDRTYAPAIRQVDWTLLTPEGEPLVQWRGIDGDIDDPVAEVSGFRPVMLQREELNGQQRLGPFNLVGSWYWVEETPEGPRPVREADLKAALLDGEGYHPHVRETLDTDADGVVTDLEQRIDSEAKAAVVRARLLAVGVADPHIEAELQPYGLHHGVGPASTATQQCEDCHSASSRLGEPFLVSSYVPGGVLPELVGDCNIKLNGKLSQDSDGQLVFQPSTRDIGLYVLGFDCWHWVHLIGLLVLVGTVFGAGIHGVMRIQASTRRKGDQPAASENSTSTGLRSES